MLCCALHCIAEESRDYTLLIMCCRQSIGSQGSLYRQVRFFKPAVKITKTYSQLRLLYLVSAIFIRWLRAQFWCQLVVERNIVLWSGFVVMVCRGFKEVFLCWGLLFSMRKFGSSSRNSKKFVFFLIQLSNQESSTIIFSEEAYPKRCFWWN